MSPLAPVDVPSLELSHVSLGGVAVCLYIGTVEDDIINKAIKFQEIICITKKVNA